MRLLRKEIDSTAEIIIDSIFISFLLVLIISILLKFSGLFNTWLVLVNIVFIMAVITIMWFVYLKEGLKIFLITSLFLMILLFFIEVSAVFILSVLFFVSPFYYYKFKKQPFSKAIKKFHLNKIDRKDILYGITLIFVISSIAMILSHILGTVGLNDDQKVYEKLMGIPKMLLLVVILIGSIGEEIFFRAFLVEKAGPFASSILFVTAHGVYESISELLIVLPIGFIFSYFYYYKKRIYPTIIAHMCFNLLMFIVLVFGLG